MKQPILIRFANEPHHATVINLDITKLTGVMQFPKEIFGTIDGIRISILREEYEQALKNSHEQTLIDIMKHDQESGLYNIDEE
jgi:hypothetical protein